MDHEHLTPEEIAWLRCAKKAQDRRRWFWKTVRTWGSWAGAVSMGLIALADAIKRLFDK